MIAAKFIRHCNNRLMSPISEGGTVQQSAKFIPFYTPNPTQVTLSWHSLVERLRLTLSPMLLL